jgi:NAD(P)-dependent dehydrogenase (short-subunit alcohol dehydrogenase family)
VIRTLKHPIGITDKFQHSIMASNTQFKDRVIAITGAASGIGLCTARILASRGAQLSLADVQAEALDKAKEELKSSYGVDALVTVTDVRKYDQVEAWIAATVKRFGKLDGAANLAGVIPKSLGNNTLAGEELEDWDFVISVNLTGVMYCMKAQLNAMADNGSIVNASSIAGTTGRARNSSYSASKHGVLGLTRSAAKEVGVKGIRVNAVCPSVFSPYPFLCQR